MKPKVLSHSHLNDDSVYHECELAKSGMRKIQFLSISLIANSICIILYMFNVVLSPVLGSILGFFYVMLLMGIYHKKLNRPRTSLFWEFSTILSHRINYFKTPDLPAEPPLSEGYLYAKKTNEEFSQPYPMNAYIMHRGKDIDFNIIWGYYVEIANYHWEGSGYSTMEWNRFKLQCLKDFEKSGYVVEGLRDKWGVRLWCRGHQSRSNKVYKYFDICQLMIYKGLVIVSILTPFLFLTNFLDWSTFTEE